MVIKTQAAGGSLGVVCARVRFLMKTVDCKVP